ncbi:MAG: cobalt transporter CbiM [Thermodesulfobacteriota bacterium]|nr:cobalt transporter CbiM [Thermodesulfobacteriota bacterium]
MHISEGVLSASVLAGGGALTVIGTIIGLKRVSYDRIMSVAILSSAFFVASLVHLPVGPGSVHLLLNGLMGLILGWACFPALLAALFLQAVFFQFGGIIVLGVNTFNMAAPALLCSCFLRPWLFAPGFKGAAAAYVGGFFSVLLSSLCVAFCLALTDEGFIKTAGILVATHFPIMIIEGFVTMFIVSFLTRVQPDIFQMAKPR